MKKFLKHFLKVNKVQLIVLPVVLILAILSGIIYFNFDKIISSKAQVSVKEEKTPKNISKKEGARETKKGEAPASSGKVQSSQKGEKSQPPASTKSTKTGQSLPTEQSPQLLSEDQPPFKNQQENQTETINAELSIDHGVEKTYFVEVTKGSTVYDLLKKASSQYGFSLEASYDPAYGAFIEEIDGARNNPQEGKYWFYYLNGKLAPLGASSQKLSAGDKVLWKYEKSK